MDKLWGSGKRVSQDEVVELTNQFYVTLRTYFSTVKDKTPRNQDAFNRATELLQPDKHPQSWSSAYEIEQLLVHLYDDDTVATELGVRILEARAILRPELTAMYDAQIGDIVKAADAATTAEAKTSVADRRRVLLARLVDDLQWRYIVNEATRRYSKLITKRTAVLSITALTVFVLVFLIPWDVVRFRYEDLDLLWVAGLAGTWGATFSMLATLSGRLEKSTFDQLKLMKAASMLVSRAAIGAGAACILYFFLLSGLLGGAAFPRLTLPEPGPAATLTTMPAPTPTPLPTPLATPQPPSSPSPAASPAAAPPRAGGPAPVASPAPPGTPTSTVTPTPTPTPTPAPSPSPSPTPRSGSSTAPLPPLPVRDLALLIVWCFIAGFSERLVPGLLTSTEARAGAGQATDRQLPTTATTEIPSAVGTQAAGPGAPPPAQGGRPAPQGAQPAGQGGQPGPGAAPVPQAPAAPPRAPAGPKESPEQK